MYNVFSGVWLKLTVGDVKIHANQNNVHCKKTKLTCQFAKCHKFHVINHNIYITGHLSYDLQHTHGTSDCRICTALTHPAASVKADPITAMAYDQSGPGDSAPNINIPMNIIPTATEKAKSRTNYTINRELECTCLS